MFPNRVGEEAVEAGAVGRIEVVDVVRGDKLDFGALREPARLIQDEPASPHLGGVFYGPSNAIAERAFLGFEPSDSYETARPAVSVIFDLGGTPTTMPTIVTRETQGLIDGFSAGYLHFVCF